MDHGVLKSRLGGRREVRAALLVFPDEWSGIEEGIFG